MLMTLIKRPLLISAAVGAALLSTAALAGAQQAPDKGRESDARHEPEMGQPKAGEQPGVGSKGVEHPGKGQPKSVEHSGKDQPKSVERPGKDQPKSVGRTDNDRPKGAERVQPDKDRTKGAEQQGQPKGTRLSEQQRSAVGTKLRETRVEKARVQVSVNVGSHVPRSVHLHALPGTVLAVAPAYRGYSYFVQEDDTIVIVDPRSYVVIDVIPASTRAAGLSLSPEQMHLIYVGVPRDRTVDVRVRLALGAEVPANVELLPFPAEVRARVPEVEGYRYIVTRDDVVIVDPRNRDVVLVISE
jgi:hypothetical protein